MKLTWIIHFIPCGKPSYHTHGLDQYGSLELELNLPLQPRQATQFSLAGRPIARRNKVLQMGDQYVPAPDAAGQAGRGRHPDGRE